MKREMRNARQEMDFAIVQMLKYVFGALVFNAFCLVLFALVLYATWSNCGGITDVLGRLLKHVGTN